MAITIDDINLKRFLETCAPTAFPEAGKLTLSNENFLWIASLLKISMQLERIAIK